MNSQENRELIIKYLEGIDSVDVPSIKCYLKDRKISGSLLRRLDNMLEQKEILVQERDSNKSREYYCGAISQGFLNKDCLNKQCEDCKNSST